MSKVIFLTILVFSVLNVSSAQENIAQEVYAIFQQNCLGCHGKGGAFTEELIIEYTELINSGTVVPGKPESSELYKRLLGNTDRGQQMPLGQPPLTFTSINTINRWILNGAPDWKTQHDIDFITPEAMLNSIKTHLELLNPFDRVFARYFTLTHLHNAGETPETLKAHQTALSKLINSLSWRAEIHTPQPIDRHATIFFIDLRDYQWDIQDTWTLIENVYPYPYGFSLPIYDVLRQEMNCNVPYIYADWFIANASRPPLYHDILDLPETVTALERKLKLDVVKNLINAPGINVWRAGFNDSGVSNHNRVVERHVSKYGAYWKSYDFAGSAGTQNIFTHPLNFKHDGGEIVFNLPNGLQGYYLADANGNRLDAAPIEIVSNPAADDPTVRNGISCIGCHTEGMKTFEDKVRAAIEQNPKPLFDKLYALKLYPEKEIMDTLVKMDTDIYKTAVEKTGAAFGGVEPIHRCHEAFFKPLTAAHAASNLGLETKAFLNLIQEKPSLQNLGLSSLTTPNGTVKRDTWTQHFAEIAFVIHEDTETILIHGIYSNILDSNLRAAIKKELGKENLSILTSENMQQLKFLNLTGMGIRSLSGIEGAINLAELHINGNPISDISPLADLTNLRFLFGSGMGISDLTPLANLTKLETLRLSDNEISDISPLGGLTQLKNLHVGHNKISDVSPLANLTQLKWGDLRNNDISDFSPLDKLLQSASITLFKNPGFPSGGTKIEKPLLWVTVPGELDPWGFTHVSKRKDLLAAASSNLVTEKKISTNGATERESVGNNIWRIGELDGETADNINTMLQNNEIYSPELPDYIIYLCYTFYSPSEQNTKLFFGSDFGAKTWLNGTLIHKNEGYYGHPDYQTFLPITLKQGKNVLLVAVDNSEGDQWGVYFGFAQDTPYTTIPPYDVNQDGQIDILDLVLVAQDLNKHTAKTDINGDGIVDILDLVIVANHIGE